MKIGLNLLLWTTHVTEQHDGILEQLAAAGYDGVEVPIFIGDPDHYAALGKKLDALGLQRSVVAVIPDLERNPAGAEREQQAKAEAWLRHLIDCTAALGADVLCGPLHSTIGHFSGHPPTAEERARAVAVHQAVAEHAAQNRVVIALEALNRFECYLLNTMQDLAEHVAAVGHPAIGGMYDTFHCNIEEKDPVGVITAERQAIRHIHLSENDRGTPGRGHIPWDRVFAEIKASGYEGWLTIEAFGRALPDLAAATRVWRDFFPSSDQVWQEGLALIRQGMARG